MTASEINQFAQLTIDNPSANHDDDIIKIFNKEFSYPLNVYEAIGFVELLKKRGVTYTEMANACKESQLDFSLWRHKKGKSHDVAIKVLRWLHTIFEKTLPPGISQQLLYV